MHPIPREVEIPDGCASVYCHSHTLFIYMHDSWANFEETWHRYQRFGKKNQHIFLYMLLLLLNIHQQSCCTDLLTAAPNSVRALFTLTWEGEKRRRGRKVSQFRPNREWHYCQLAIPSQQCSLVLSVFVSLFLELSAGGDKSCAAVCGDQPAISARHLGTVCPLGSFPRSQHADNGRGREVLLWAGNVSGGQQRKQA